MQLLKTTNKKKILPPNKIIYLFIYQTLIMMTVLSNSISSTTIAGGGGKQVYPVNYEAQVSQLLLDSLTSNDLTTASQCVADPFLDVNFIGAVSLKLRHTDLLLHDYLPNETVVHYHDFKADVTPLFLAAHFGNLSLLRTLLNSGADVNQKLFRGYAISAGVREGHMEIVKVLVKGGASQPGCEEALLEASIHGRACFVKLLMDSDLIRPHVALHAFVTASARGFTHFLHTMLKCGVDANAMDRRVLVQSSKPSLHTNIDCNAIVAAVVSRHASVVRLLLQADVRTDIEVKLGAWSWDMDYGEEFRVGAGLAEQYPLTWCAVEYFEISGTILRALLKKHSPNTPHLGRTLLHHAILCANSVAVNVLLDSGADIECPIKTNSDIFFRPLHMAARLGLPTILRALLEAGCDVNSTTDSGDTALMISAKYKREECTRILATAGADFGLINNVGNSISTIASTNKWALGFQQAVLQIIKAGKVPKSSNFSSFSPLLFTAQAGETEALKMVIAQPETDIDQVDDNGFNAVLLAASKGHVECFRILVYANADVKRCTKSGESMITLSEMSRTRDLFEKVLLEYALKMDNRNAEGFYALHCAARRGDLEVVKLLTNKGYDVNAPDGDCYTALMLAAREGHAHICKFLIIKGARCDVMNIRGETALLLARKNSKRENDAEAIILDELARRLVCRGAWVQKHTKRGKGSPHAKMIKMVGTIGILSWGASRRRNVICQEVEVGPSARFRKNRRGKSDADAAGVFHVVTTKNKEVHFVCEGGCDVAKLWVRGIKLLTKKDVSSSKPNCT